MHTLYRATQCIACCLPCGPLPRRLQAYQQTSAKEPKKNSDGDKVYAVGAYVNPDTADKEEAPPPYSSKYSEPGSLR